MLSPKRMTPSEPRWRSHEVLAPLRVAGQPSYRDDWRRDALRALRAEVDSTMKILMVGGPLHRKLQQATEDQPKAFVHFTDGLVAHQYFLADASASGISPLDVALIVGDDREVDTSRVYVYGGRT